MIQRQKAGMIKMINMKTQSLTVGVLLLFIFQVATAFEYVDFDASMRVEQFEHTLGRSNNSSVYRFFKLLYEKNKRTVPAQEDATVRIPKIIHHVWFGQPLSEYFKELRQTWIDTHPDWIFILWTDDAANDSNGHVVSSFMELDALLKIGEAGRIVVKTDALSFDNRVQFDVANNYGERSDILKWEIVYRYGGVYIDTDFECYKPLDTLHATFDFYTALQPLDTHRVQLGAALFAAHPGHPILEGCVRGIKPGKGPIVVRTGPIHFTNVCVKTILESPGYNMVLPSGYLYPCGYDQQNLPEATWRTPEAFGVHHWSGSWLKPEAFTG